MGAALDPKFNELLAALPADEFEQLRPLLEPVDLALGEILYESGKRQAHVFFPTDSIVSLVYVMENGASAEVAIAGCEGLVGVSLFMGGETTPSRALVQSAGSGFRIKGALLRKAFDRGVALRQLFLRYTQALLTQMAQTAVCNRHHTVDQQLCRWLLMSIDRLPSNKLVMTQELIANMLGVRRGGVTEAAGKLQDANIILYRRGRIEVIDRPKLEQMVCECYEVVRKEYARLLPWTATTNKVSSLAPATDAATDRAHPQYIP
ncbi:MAG: Crp/Fnr family transcriptional regulator [Rhodanobacteraceae bacterium]